MGKNILIIAGLLISLNASANVVINTTRVVFPSDAKSVSIQLINKSRDQHLIQSWVDDGRQNEKPENVIAPFTIVPPVVKINGNDGQILRINRKDQITRFSTDRETVFWINILDIPPVPEKMDAGKDYLQMAIRNRIKLFWRPASLKISTADIPNHLGIKHNGSTTCIDNATPYYITLIQMMKWDGKSTGVQQGKKQDNLISRALFVPPFSCQTPAEGAFSPQAGKYQLVYIDDYGSRVPLTVTLK